MGWLVEGSSGTPWELRGVISGEFNFGILFITSRIARGVRRTSLWLFYKRTQRFRALQSFLVGTKRAGRRAELAKKPGPGCSGLAASAKQGREIGRSHLVNFAPGLAGECRPDWQRSHWTAGRKRLAGRCSQSERRSF